MSPVSLGNVVMDYLLMSILSMMALCCTVAVLDSSCDRTDRTDCQEYSHTTVMRPCQDSYVDREGHTVTMVTCQQEGMQMV